MTFGEYYICQFSVVQMLEFALRVVAACMCGAVIGFERSRRFKEAGVRTHIIVCSAAALFMLISKYGFADLTDASGTTFNGTRGADPARIAAQAVSGISFLGAGVIFKNGSTVKGLTTAAGIWATAGIGLALGCGMYVLGIFVTLVIALLQVIMHRFTVGADSFFINRLCFTVADNEPFGDQLDELLREWDAQTLSGGITRADGGITYDLTLKMPRSISLGDVSEFMSNHSAVKSAEGTPVS